jgi:hypothetical protein
VRSRRIGSGGTKLEATEPRSVILASQNESARSVFGRPGSALTCRRCTAGSRTRAIPAEKTGFQQSPVASIRTRVTPQQASQSAQRLQLAPGGAVSPGLLLPTPGNGVTGTRMVTSTMALGDVQAGDPLGEQWLILHVVHRRLLRWEGVTAAVVRRSRGIGKSGPQARGTMQRP